MARELSVKITKKNAKALHKPLREFLKSEGLDKLYEARIMLKPKGNFSAGEHKHCDEDSFICIDPKTGNGVCVPKGTPC